jgi:Ca2+-binding RTX toxin-like protein
MAWFTFTDVSNETFVIRLTEPGLVDHARALLAGEPLGDSHIAGTVVKTPLSYNAGWSYHIENISFFESSTEVGDSTMRYIETHLAQVGGALLPGSVWTGWSSALVGELAALHGSTGHDALSGSASADIVFGKSGDDTVLAGAGNDHLIGDAGHDTLSGGAGSDKLNGGIGGDDLRGAEGADVLAGGRGADRLYAGLDDERDRVVYLSKADLLEMDRVFQFDSRDQPSETVWDKIDLRSIDADAQRSGNQSFRFVDEFASATGSEPDGQLRVVDQGTDVRVEIDFNGDSVADAFILVRGVASLSEADFFL